MTPVSSVEAPSTSDTTDGVSQGINIDTAPSSELQTSDTVASESSTDQDEVLRERAETVKVLAQLAEQRAKPDVIISKRKQGRKTEDAYL